MVWFCVCVAVLGIVFNGILHRYLKKRDLDRERPGSKGGAWLFAPLLFGGVAALIPFRIIFYVVFTACLWLYYGYLFKGRRYLPLFLTVFVVFHMIALEGIWMTGLALWGDGTYRQIMEMPRGDLVREKAYVPCVLGLLFLGMWVKGSRKEKADAADAPYGTLVKGTAPFTVSFLILTYIYELPDVSRGMMGIYLFIFLSSVLVFHLFCRYVAVAERVMAEEESIGWNLDRKLDVQLENYKKQAEYIEQFRRFRYEYRNQLNGLTYLLDEGTEQDIREYMKEMMMHAREQILKYKQYSNTPMVDALLQDAAGRCHEKGIDFSAMVDIRNNFGLTDLELSVVMGNVLDNAWEAVTKTEDPGQWIELESSVKGNWQAVVCRNTYRGSLKKKGQAYLTTKEGAADHGMGLRKITEVIESHGGMVTINADGKVFTITLCMRVTDETQTDKQNNRMEG